MFSSSVWCLMVNFAFTIDTVTNDVFFFGKAALDRERCILSDKMCVMVTVLTVNYTHLTSLGGGEAGDRSLFFGFNINFTNTHFEWSCCI